MGDRLLMLYIQHTFRPRPAPTAARARRNDRGEGVISAAIAVLIMAFLGVAVWGGFKLTFDKTQKNVNEQVDLIGK